MENIWFAIKRFFKNKNTITIIAVLLALGILYWAYDFRIKKATEPKSVPVAAVEIGPRTLITDDMVTIKKVPGGIVRNSEVLTSTADIIGKYVSNKAVIPAGSLFYKSTVLTWDELPSSIYEDIPEGNTVVALPVSLETTYGNSIFPGNYIDLYYVGYNDDGKLMLGKFIESIKVLAVIDSSGNDIFETSGSLNNPSYLTFSVPEELHLLLRKASYLTGTIFPVPRNAEYSNNPSNTRISSSYIQNYILNQTIDVSKENEKYITSDSTIDVLGGNN